jgi:hypothetical protein
MAAGSSSQAMLSFDAGATPVTGGVSLAGAAVSVAAATEMVARGVDKALDT